MRHSVPVWESGTGRTGLQIARSFQEPILWAQFWYLIVSRKVLKSFMVMTVLVTRKIFWRLVENFWENVLIACIPPSPKSHIHWHFPLIGAVSQSYLGYCLQSCHPHFAPNKNLIHNSNIMHFFKSMVATRNDKSESVRTCHWTWEVTYW